MLYVTIRAGATWGLCHEPSAGVVDNLEFKIKKEGSYNYEYKKGLRPQPHYA
jgi:hypothetical protein